MEKQFYRSSNSELNGSSKVPFFYNQSPVLNEAQEDDWSLSKFFNLLRRRKPIIIIVILTIMSGVIINIKLNPKPLTYGGSFRLLVEPIDNNSQPVNVVKEESRGAETELDYESQIHVLKSPELMENLVKNLQVIYPDVNYYSLISALSIRRLDETKLIEVSYSSQNPEQTKVVLEQIAKEYLEYSRERRQTRLRQGIQFVEQELPSLQNRVDYFQKELQIFRQKYEFKDPESRASQIDTQAFDLSKKREVINLQIAQARANLALLQTDSGKALALTEAPQYQQLFEQTRQLDAQIATTSTILQENNPIIRTLREKRASLMPLVHQEAQRHIETKLLEATTRLKTLEVDNQELIKNEQILERQRKQIPILIRQYTEIQRRLQVTTESLNRFLSTRENLQIQLSQTELGWQLLQPPTQPVTVTASDTVRSLIVGFCVSIFLGIATALLIDKLNNTYHNVYSLKKNIKLPILGNIPFEKLLQSKKYADRQGLKLRLGDQNPLLQGSFASNSLPKEDYSNYSGEFLEALRVLYTNIQLLNSDHQIRSLVISSAMPGDGKSTVAFHLARIASAMGQRVLLVDADLRQPTIHKLSNLNISCGLSNLISTNLQLTEVLLQPPSISQLNVITAGSLPPDPTKLLSSKKMKHLMEEFRNQFDLVIYDVPSLVGLADTSLIASHTDGILLIVRIDKTDSSILKRTIDDLKVTPVDILGIVANAHNSKYGDY